MDGAAPAHFNFDESEEREFSIEVDPRTVDAERDRRNSADLGFNRLSLGIQDFDRQASRKPVNRIQSVLMKVCKLVLMESAQYNWLSGSISFDLIYGLPHQTVDTFNQVRWISPSRFEAGPPRRV